MKLITIMMTTFIISTKNPVKMSLFMMIMVNIMMMYMWIMSNMTWIPMIILLMFTSGILMMFLILSTFHPNQEMSKWKMSKILILSTWLIILLIEEEMGTDCMESKSSMMKIFYQSFQTITSITIMISIYFTIFSKIIKKEENSMRMTMCQKKIKFVNW